MPGTMALRYTGNDINTEVSYGIGRPHTRGLFYSVRNIPINYSVTYESLGIVSPYYASHDLAVLPLALTGLDSVR